MSPGTRCSAGDCVTSPVKVPEKVRSPAGSHIPVRGIWEPYTGMSAHVTCPNTCESASITPPAPKVPRKSKRWNGSVANSRASVCGPAVHEKVPPRVGPYNGIENG